MKILHTVESYDPASHGMQQVVKQLSERLVILGHEVTVATSYQHNRENLLINGVKIEEFKISGRIVGGFNAEDSELERYRDFLLNSDFDVIANFAAQTWTTDIVLPILTRIKAVKIFVPTGFSELENVKFGNYFSLMKRWMKEYDMNVFHSYDYQDINFARDNGVEKVVFISNGASAEEFVVDNSVDIRGQLGIPKDHFLILHVGSHTGLKGHKEAIEIFKKSKIKNTTLLIIGNSTHHNGKFNYLAKFLFKSFGNLFSIFTEMRFFPACFISCKFNSIFYKLSYDKYFNDKQLVVVELSRKKTIAAYMVADLFLFPSNIECSPLVLFECMASKTPFLATDVGNVKEIIAWSNSGRLLPTLKLNNGLRIADVEKSVDFLEEFFSDKEDLQLKSFTGFEAFTNNYSWDIISKNYETLYKSCISKIL